MRQNIACCRSAGSDPSPEQKAILKRVQANATHDLGRLAKEIMNAIIVIPARLRSTRLPRKLLLNRTGKTLLQHTYESASRSSLADRVVVAADDEEIVDAVKAFGGEVVLTASDHVCGTDRVAEVAAALQHDVVVNVQGDEPEVDAGHIDAVIDVFARNANVGCATLATAIRSRQLLEDPACVKVVFGQAQQAIYFSRSVIPYPREGVDAWLQNEPPVFWQHIGLYAYRRKYLLEISQRPAVDLERVESLEQLRILHAGDSLFVHPVANACPGIDTADDYEAFVNRQLC